MAMEASKKTGQIIHDLDALQSTNASREVDQRATRRRSSTARPALAPIKTGPESNTAVNSLQDVKLTRKRAARACDQCRRRKSRCDGQLNCSACKVVGLHCSYGHTIKQSRGPSYVAHLEKKIEELEERLKATTCSTEADAQVAKSVSQSPRHDITSTTQCSPITPDWTSLPFAAYPLIPDQFGFQGVETTYLSTVTNEPRGKPYGIDVLRQLLNHCVTGSSTSSYQDPESSLKLVQALDASVCADTLPVTSTPLLPPKPELIRWVGLAFTELWPFVDRGHVQVIIYRLYNTNTFGQEENDKDDLALLYALLALGQRFDTTNKIDVTDSRTQGSPYFCAARSFVPLQMCDRSLSALQTVVCLSLYLKSGSALTRCHAYVSAAASAGLRMGLHEEVPCLAEDEQAIKRRVWSTIRSMDIYISFMLGTPRIVSVDPSAEDPFPSQTSGFEGELATTPAHVQLCRILCRALDTTYCSTLARRPSSANKTFAITEDSMREASGEIDFWAKTCPLLSTPIENMTRGQLLLVLSRCFAELILYSPFIHHFTNATAPECTYALKAFQAALDAIRAAETLQKNLWLHEAYFHMVDLLAFVGVIMLVVQRTSTTTSFLMEALQGEKRAKELLLLLFLHNSAAREIWGLLESVGAEQGRGSSPKRPSTLFQQDSAVDVVSPVGLVSIPRR